MLAVLRLRVTGLFAVVLLVMGSCSDSSHKALSTLSEGCVLNTDCDSPLVCAFRKCHTGCLTTRDCPSGQRCVASDRPFHVCQLSDERTCSYNSQCPSGQLCGVDGQCRDQCAADRDCVQGQLCVSGTCAEPGELNGDGQLTPATDAGSAPPEGTPCAYNSECPAPFICRNGICAAECLADVDCPVGESCTNSRCTAKQTEPPDAGTTPDASVDSGTACVYNSDCTPQICRAGHCIDECKADVDCASGQICSNARCIMPTGTTDASTSPDAPVGYGDPCALPSDCPAPLECGITGRCGYECNTNVDCASGLCCFDHACVTGAVCDVGTGGSGGAGGGSSGTGGSGVACVSNEDCDDGKYCNGVERCYAAKCAPALDTPCNSHTGCIQDSCDEATRTCTHTTLAAEDGDKDGHLAFSCGGDDCDDSDDAIYTGAPELCDDKDNDCNSLIDDNSRRAHGPLMQGDALNEGYCSACGYTDYSGAGAILGSGAVMFYGSYKYGGGGALHAQLFDASGTPTGALQKLFDTASTPTDQTVVLDAAGEANTALAVYFKNHSASPVMGVIVDNTLTVLKTITLVPAASSTGYVDALWTGTQYMVGLSTYGANVTEFALIDTAGNVNGGMQLLPTPGGSTTDNGYVKVAASGSTLAAAYRETPTGQPAITILSSTGSLLAGPVVLTTGESGVTLNAVAGTPGGYVVVYSANSGGHAVFVKSDGTVGKSMVLPAGKPMSADGVQEAEGAAFALRYADGVRLGYARGALESFESSQVITVGSPNATDNANIAGSGNQLMMFYYTRNEFRMYAKATGCP